MRPHLILSILLFISGNLFAQVPAQWQATVDGSINWQHVTPSGNYLIGTTEALVCVDSETGKVKWSAIKYANITADQIQQSGSSPLITVTTKDNVDMLDPYNGQVKFSSKDAGVAEILDSYFLAKFNGILIGGKDFSNKATMVFADLTSGKVSWSINDEFGRIIKATDINGKEMLIVTLWYNYRINSKTGDQIWKSNTTTAKLEGALGNFMKNLASQQAEQMDFNVKFYRHPDKDIFYVASEQKKESSFSSSSGTPQMVYTTQYNAFSLSDGSIIWEKPLEVNGKLSQTYFDTKGILILPDNGMSTQINLFDYTTGEGYWGKKGNGIKIKGGIYDFIPSGKGLVLISSNADKNFLSYLNLSEGMLTFEKPVRISGEVAYTEEISKGILYVTTEEANILDPATGSLLLPKSIPTTPGLTASDGDKLYIFDLKENVLKALDKNSGGLSIISGGIEFEGKEDPKRIELMDEGVFIHSDQNVALVDYSGNTVYQQYYPAPREPGLKRALLYAEAVRAAYIGANAYYASAQLQSASPQVSQNDPMAGAIVESVGQVYGELGDAASDFTKQALKQANARFKATTQARDYMVILTPLEGKNNALVKVNKKTGKMDSFIDLGKEKMPDYAMDDVTGKVFYKTSASTVSGYNLN